MLNGVLWQERDSSTESGDGDETCYEKSHLKLGKHEDLVFANIIVKHSKSNAIVLAKNNQLCASGIGQTSQGLMH